MSVADELGDVDGPREADEPVARAAREVDEACDALGVEAAAEAREEAERRGASVAPPSRHAPRLSYEAVVRLQCDGRRGIHTGFVRDISRGGMFLRLVDPEPAGKRLGFELFLPGWRIPARGVGEVAWQRPSYEGPGRPPGMAIRFVALEPVAIEMLARVLPDGEAPAVEVLRPRLLPTLATLPVETSTARERANADGIAGAATADESPALSLEQLIAEAAIAPQLAPSPSPAAVANDELAELEGPMIFVPPPPVSMLPERPTAPEAVPPLRERAASSPVQPLRWGSAAAGIAAIAGLATLAVVGAARREVVVTPAERDARAEVASAAPVAPRNTDAPPLPAPSTVVGGAPLSASETAALSEAAVASPSSPPASARPAPVLPMSDAASAPARRLVSLRWEPLATGGTRVVVTLDGALDKGRVRASRIGGDSPRLVVRLLGVGDGAPRAPWEPATPDVRRVRAGLHDGDGGPEVHLVLDLVRPEVRLAKWEVFGSELYLDLM